MNLKIINLFFLCASIFLPSVSQAAVVRQFKNGKVLIENQDDEIEMNQEFFLINSQKKKVALIRISKIKDNKSIGILINGTAESGEHLLLKEELPAENILKFSDNNNNDEDSPTPAYRLSSKKKSLLLNLMNNSMSARESDAQAPTPNIDEVQMNGLSIGLTGTVDIPLNTWFEFRMILGYEPFTVSGTSRINGCDATTSRDCNANISYLSAGGYGRFDIYKSKILVWLGLGVTSKFPIAKKSTALKTDDLKLTSTYGWAIGAEYFLDHKKFIPFSIEQQYFINSDTVKAHILFLRTGVGLTF